MKQREFAKVATWLDDINSQAFISSPPSVAMADRAGGAGVTGPDYEDEFDNIDTRVSDDVAVGIHEARLYPDESKRRWNDMFAAARLTDQGDRDALQVQVLVYCIRNAYSPRAPFDKKLRVGGKEIPSVIIKQAIGADIRRFCNGEREWRLQKKIMEDPANGKLREEQGKAWQIEDQRLWKYCYEGSVNDPTLGANDRAIILGKRKIQIDTATPYIRSLAGVTTNNNTGLSTGHVSSGQSGDMAAVTGAHGVGSVGGFSAYD